MAPHDQMYPYPMERGIRPPMKALREYRAPRHGHPARGPLLSRLLRLLAARRA
jgi:hypothetical protein